MSSYLVISFDFGGSSDVKVHVATASVDLAQTVYEEVCAECDAQNARCAASGAAKRLVERARVPADKALVGAEALTLFWGGGSSTNNNNTTTD